MNKARRSVLTGIVASVGSGVVNATDAPEHKHIRENKSKTDMPSKKSALTKADLQIKHDLAFPYQHLNSSYKERLHLIEKYMRSENLTEEHYCKGEAISRLEAKLATLFW